MIRVAAWVVAAVLGLLAGFWLTDETTVRVASDSARCVAPLVGAEETGAGPPRASSATPTERRLAELCVAEVRQRTWWAGGAALGALVAGSVAIGVTGRWDVPSGAGQRSVATDAVG